LTFSEAPSSGADNIEVVTVATSSVGSTTSDLVTFSPSGTGATNRTTQAKLRDVVSVKDFGAQGDGTTDDSSAIIAAMAALASAGGGTLVFPAGTYIVESECDQGSCSAAFMYRGEGATIKCAASSLIYRMFDIRPNGHNFSMEGLEFDADSKARECVRVTEANQDSSTLLVRDCGFHNTTMSGSSSGNSGLVSLGGWDKVVVDNCSFTGHTRPQGSGNPGSAGTSGCIISASGSVYPRYVSVQNSIFEDITNGDSGTSTYNCDADGLKIMGATTTGSSYLYSSATVSNNIFRNCKGRSVKVQNDETAVIGNTFYRNILPKKGGSSEVNLQVGSGEVSSNKFHYDETSGSESPFDDGGSTDAGSWPISFYNSEEDSRPAMCTAANNTVYNNVTASVGALRSIVDFTGAVGDHSRVLTVSGNKATGKTDSFITATPEPSTGGAVHVHATDNFANEIGTAFLDLNGSGGYDKNFVTLTGNVNAGTAKPAAWYPGGSTVPNANYSVTNCVNLTEDSESTGYLKNRAPTTFASRIPAIAPDSSVGGLLSIQAATVADDATWNTSPRGYYGAFAVRVLSVGYSSATTAIFVDGSSTAAPTDLGNSGSSVVFISEGGTETDGKVNVWRNTTTGGVSIKNRLGSNRVFTLVTMG